MAPATSFRHTCFTRFREGGMAIEAVQAQAGHRWIASTRIYLHLSIDWLAEEYRRAMEALQGTAGGGPMRAQLPQAAHNSVAVVEPDRVSLG